MLFLTLGKSFLVLNYHINKKTITETKCENKDKPQMHCNGQCYLAKQLKQAEEKETAIPNLNQLKDLSLYFNTKAESLRFFSDDSFSFTPLAYLLSEPIKSYPGSVFHPPEYMA